MADLTELEDHAARLRNHIARIRIDFPEAADARRLELRQVYTLIATRRRALDVQTEPGEQT